MQAELRECPFCGESGAEVMRTEGTIRHPHYYIQCDWCGARSGGSDKGEHINLWNTRAIPTPADMEKWESLREAAKYVCALLKGLNGPYTTKILLSLEPALAALDAKGQDNG